MATQIKKGSEVWMITEWNECSVKVQRVLIKSFGKKQGTAVHMEDGRNIETRIYPSDVRTGMLNPNEVMCYRIIIAVEDVADICEFAMRQARDVKAYYQRYYLERAHSAVFSVKIPANDSYSKILYLKARAQFDTPAYVVGL